MAVGGHAQNLDRIRRIAALIPLSVDDPLAQARVSALMEGLQQLGWAGGRNIRIEIRWAAANAFGAHMRSAFANMQRN